MTAAQPRTPARIVSDRQLRMLRSAMGPAIIAALDDPDIVEVMLNPDGRLWVDRLGAGREPTGATLSHDDATRIIKVVANHVGLEVDRDHPILSAELPETGERFEGVLPPITFAPTFAIRKRAAGGNIFYLQSGRERTCASLPSISLNAGLVASVAMSDFYDVNLPTGPLVIIIVTILYGLSSLLTARAARRSLS